MRTSTKRCAASPRASASGCRASQTITRSFQCRLAASVAKLREMKYDSLTSAFMLGNGDSMAWHWRNGFVLLPNPASMRYFEQRMKDSKHGLNGRAYLEPEHVSRAVLYLVTDDDGVITGQVMEVGLGGPARSIG